MIIIKVKNQFRLLGVSISSINIFEDDEVSGSYSTMLANTLSMKLNTPIFLSMNINNEKLLATGNFISFDL